MKKRLQSLAERLLLRRWRIALAFTLTLFAGLIAVLIFRDRLQEFFTQLIPEYERLNFLLYRLFDFFGFSGLIGLGLAWYFAKQSIDAIRLFIEATRKVSTGDFSARVNIKGRGISELHELSRAFNNMTQELANTETLRSDFINTFSHELKTPLMSLRGFAKLLKEGSLPPEEQQEYLDIIIAESERLAALATNTLDLSKYEHIGILADKAPFRLDEQIRRTLALAEPQWSAKNLAVSVSLEEVTLVGREDLTQQIWVNLLDNAIKFTPPGGTIRIRLRKTGEGIRFTIRDDGAGMDEHALAHCFDKFFQSNPSASGTGSGLGLAIARRIVELSGGEITAESEAGKGSLFTVIF